MNVAGRPDQTTYLVILMAQFAYFFHKYFKSFMLWFSFQPMYSKYNFLKKFQTKILLSKLSAVKTLKRVDVEMFKG